MKFKELVKVPEQDGWEQSRVRGGHRQNVILTKEERSL